MIDNQRVTWTAFAILTIFENVFTNLHFSASNLGAADENVNTTTPTAKEEEEYVHPTNPSVEKKQEEVENSSQTLITSSHDGVGGGGGIERSTTDLWPENPIRISDETNLEEENSQGNIGGEEAQETGLEGLLGSWAAFAQPLLIKAKVDYTLYLKTISIFLNQESTKERVARLLANNPLIDGHNDFPLSIRWWKG